MRQRKGKKFLLYPQIQWEALQLKLHSPRSLDNLLKVVMVLWSSLGFLQELHWCLHFSCFLIPAWRYMYKNKCIQLLSGVTINETGNWLDKQALFLINIFQNKKTRGCLKQKKNIGVQFLISGYLHKIIMIPMGFSFARAMHLVGCIWTWGFLTRGCHKQKKIIIKENDEVQLSSSSSYNFQSILPSHSQIYLPRP